VPSLDAMQQLIQTALQQGDLQKHRAYRSILLSMQHNWSLCNYTDTRRFHNQMDILYIPHKLYYD